MGLIWLGINLAVINLAMINLAVIYKEAAALLCGSLFY